MLISRRTVYSKKLPRSTVISYFVCLHLSLRSPPHIGGYTCMTLMRSGSDQSNQQSVIFHCYQNFERLCQSKPSAMSVRLGQLEIGLEPRSRGFEKQKQINRGDPREIRLWYPGIQAGSAPEVFTRCATHLLIFFFFFHWLAACFWVTQARGAESARPVENFQPLFSRVICLHHHNSSRQAGCCLTRWNLHLNWLHATVIHFLEREGVLATALVW